MTKSQEERLAELIKGRPARTGPQPATTDTQPVGDSPTATAAGPAPQQAGRERVTVSGQEIVLASMASSDYSPAPLPQGLAIRLRPDGPDWAADIEWPAPPPDARASGPHAGVDLFRIIIGDGEPPESDCGPADLTLALTTDLFITDHTAVNPPLALTRYYEVWRYRGPTLAQAATRPPQLYAEGSLVWPPMNLSARVDHGQVVVRWGGPADPGARYAWVAQTPREARTGATVERATPVAGIGFVDTDATPGQPVVYAVFAGREQAGAVSWSAVPARVRVEPPEEIGQILDLQVVAHPTDPGLVHLTWTPPKGGQVSIYRTAQSPGAESHTVGVIDESVLTTPDFGLHPQFQLAQVATAEQGRMWIRDVPIPPGQAETYFTPVTRSGKQALPGRTQSWLRPMPPTKVGVEDRLESVLVTFAWPAGASLVRIFATRDDRAIDPSGGKPVATLSEEEHRVYGAFRIPRSALPVGSVHLHLVGYKLHGGMEAHSQVTTVVAELPAVVRYDLIRTRALGRFGRRRLLLELRSATTVGTLNLRLVWRPDSLPLAVADATRTLCKLPHVSLTEAGQRVTVELTDLLTEPLPQTGFLRLLSNPADPVALLDPPIEALLAHSETA